MRVSPANRRGPKVTAFLTSTRLASTGSFQAGLSQDTRLDRSVQFAYKGDPASSYCEIPLSTASMASINSLLEVNDDTQGCGKTTYLVELEP